MSRTEGVSLPRLPRPHTRVTSPGAIRPHQATRERSERKAHKRALSEPNYTAYIGTPRQDVPREVYRDAAMFDEVFDKKGALLLSRNTPKITSPLSTLQYSSLHDPHCQKLFLNNRRLRSHLVNMGLITCDLKVVASTTEQRQKIRAHELLERREQLIQKLEVQEQQRLERLQQQMQLPQLYRESILKDEKRRVRAEQVQRMKLERYLQSEAEKKQRENQLREERKRKLKEGIEMARLQDQARRNSARAQQEIAEMMAYEKQYGKFGRQLALWHRESDEIHNKMIMMERKYWARMRHKRQQQQLAETFESGTRSSSASSGSLVDIECISQIHPPTESQPAPHTSSEPRPEGEVTTAVEGEQSVAGEAEEERKVSVEHLEEETEQKGTIDKPSSTGEEEPSKSDEKEEEDSEGHAEDSEKKEEDKSSEMKEDRQDSDKNQSAEVINVLPQPEESIVLLDREDSATELTKILLEALRRDHDIDANLGYLQIEEFIQVLNSRDLGLELNEGELLYIAEQVDININGWIPLVEMVPELPSLLLAIYNQRAEQAMHHYGSYLEEQWCQIYLPDGGVAYFNKLTGVLQYGGRPDDFRPNLKDEVFEESIVDFFETADANKDGVLDYNDFYSLLVSPMVSTRVYSNQIEELLQLFETYSADGLMILDQFVVVAKTLLIMIYQNAYPDVEDWIELQTRKYGTVLFNKLTGEVALSSTTTQQEEGATITAADAPPSSHTHSLSQHGSEGKDTPQPALKKRKKHARRVSWSDDATPTSNTTPTGRASTSQEASSRPTSQTAPPPLRRRRSGSKSQEKSRSATAESTKSAGGKEENLTVNDSEVDVKQYSNSENPIPIPSQVDSEPIPDVNDSEVDVKQDLNSDNPIPIPSQVDSEPIPDVNDSEVDIKQDSNSENPIPIPSQVDSEPIPDAKPDTNTDTSEEDTKKTDNNGDGKADKTEVAQDQEQDLDTNLSTETAEVKGSVPITLDPIPEAQTTKDSSSEPEGLAGDKSEEATAAELQTGDEETKNDSQN